MNMSQLLRRVLTSRIAQFALYSVAFLSTLGTAKALFALMGATHFAEYTVLFSVSLFVRILWHNVGVSAFARFYPSADTGDGRSFLMVLLTFLTIPVLVAAPAIALMMLFGTEVQVGELVLDQTALIGAILLGIATGTNALITEMDNVAFNRIRASLAMIVPGMALLVAALIAGAYDMSVTTMVLLAAGLIFTLDILHLWAFLRFASRRLPQTSAPSVPAARTMARAILAFATPLIIWTGPAILLRVADRWLAAAMLDLDMVALFGIIVTLSQNAFTAVYSVLNRAYVPDIYKHAALGTAEGVARGHAIVTRISLMLAGIGLLAFVIALVAGGPILSIMSEPRFADYGWLLAVMMLGSAIYIIGDCYLLHGHVVKNLKPYIPSKVVPPLLYIVLAAILATSIGVAGMIYAYLLAAIVYVAMAHFATLSLRTATPSLESGS